MWRLNHGPAFNWKEHRGRSVLRMVGWVVGGIVLACVFAIIFGWVVMWLWNWLMPGLFGLKTITFWQAFGIVVLAKILFSGFGHHGDRHAHRILPKTAKPFQEDSDMPEEERVYYRNFWEEEGKQAFEKFVERMKEK